MTASANDASPLRVLSALFRWIFAPLACLDIMLKTRHVNHVESDVKLAAPTANAPPVTLALPCSKTATANNVSTAVHNAATTRYTNAKAAVYKAPIATNKSAYPALIHAPNASL